MVKHLFCIYFLFLGFCWALETAVNGDQIYLAMDLRKGLNPAFTSDLFTMSLLSNTSSNLRDFDLVVHANFENLKSAYEAANTPLPIYLQNNDPAIKLFENKINWKAWMHSIGLGDYVPRTYAFNHTSLSASEDIQFPAILKLNAHFGKGVFVIHDAKQLHVVAASAIRHNLTFWVEEGLTGMGLAEVSSYGSVYQGKLLSLRCIKRYFPPKNAARSAHYWYNGSVTHAQPNDAFVRGFMLNNKHDVYIPCSQELVNVTTTMFAKAPPYTGLFCSDMKSDNHDRVKMMEINARFCGSMVKNEAIFTAAYVPLAYAVYEDGKNKVQEKIKSSRIISWPIQPKYAFIKKAEEDLLLSGGGFYNNVAHTVVQFNHSLVIDKPSYSAN